MIECYFTPKKDTTSATICANCGKEKILHTIGEGVKVKEAAKNHPDTFLAGALYVIDNYKLNSPLMSAEQYSSGAIHSLGEFPTTKSMSAEQVELLEASKIALHTLDCIEFTRDYGTASKRLESAISKFTTTTVKAEGWVSVEEFWNSLTDEQRLQLRSCKGCGSLDTSCQCWNDE